MVNNKSDLKQNKNMGNNNSQKINISNTSLPEEVINKKNVNVKLSESIIKNMNNDNKEVAKIWNEKGVGSAVEFMLKDVSNGKMTYAEMREKYG